MTDQHQGQNPPHQHGPYPPASPQYPDQPAGPIGQQATPPAGTPGPAPATAPSSKRPIIIAVVVALVMVFGGILAYNTFFNSDMLTCGMRDGSGTAVDADLIWQMTQIPEGEEAGARVFIGQLTEHITGLQTACADPGSPPK
ncbi:MAG TPA: hypothetical protein VFX60_08775 [Micromonospora sp.]|nr:hypothetical protein [Micromonospora sp.]